MWIHLGIDVSDNTYKKEETNGHKFQSTFYTISVVSGATSTYFLFPTKVTKSGKRKSTAFL